MLLNFWLHNIKLIKMIRNGLTNSIGWNLGRKYRSIHLFEPLTSTPIIGTKIKNMSDKKNNREEYFRSCSFLIEDNTKIIIIPNKIKTKWLKKIGNHLYLIYQKQLMMWKLRKKIDLLKIIKQSRKKETYQYFSTNHNKC